MLTIMIEDLDPCSAEDMLWEWAKAEVKSSRFSRYFDELSVEIRSKLYAGDRSQINAAEFHAITTVVRQKRGPLISGPLRLQTKWYTGRLRLTSLLELRVMNWPPFVSLCPSRQLSEFVESLDRSETPTDDALFLSNYQDLRKNYDESKFNERLILITNQICGPFTIVEGYTRLSVLCSRTLHNQPITLPHIKVIIGVCPKLSEWYFNDDPSGICLS
jgi:hypothetical protein